MNDDIREAIELIIYMCEGVTDLPVTYPEDENTSSLRCIKKIANKILEVTNE